MVLSGTAGLIYPSGSDDRPLPEYFLLRQAFGAPSPMMSPANLAAAGLP